jgi:hypothetical protein
MDSTISQLQLDRFLLQKKIDQLLDRAVFNREMLDALLALRRMQQPAEKLEAGLQQVIISICHYKLL